MQPPPGGPEASANGKWVCSRQPQSFFHDLIINLLTLLGGKVQAHFIDHLDADVAEPVIPAIGTDIVKNLLAQVIAHGWFGQFARVGPGPAAGTLAAEAVTGGGSGFL